MISTEDFKKVSEHGRFVSQLITDLADVQYLILKHQEGKLEGYYKKLLTHQLNAKMKNLSEEPQKNYIDSHGCLFTFFNEMLLAYQNLNLNTYEHA